MKRGKSPSSTFALDAGSRTVVEEIGEISAPSSPAAVPAMDSQLVASSMANQSVSFTLSQNLLDYFDRELAARLAWLDGPDNTWRKIIAPLARRSSCVHLALLSFVATHMSCTSSADHAWTGDMRTLGHRLREKSLVSLSTKMRHELDHNDPMPDQRRMENLSEIIAGMLSLCHEGMVDPSSTAWQIHLRACRIAIDRYTLAVRRGTDSGTDQLIHEVVELAAFRDLSSFKSEKHENTAACLSFEKGSFWGFTAFMNQVTALERRLSASLKKGARLKVDMMPWRASLEHTLMLVSAEASATLAPSLHERFQYVIETHYYACLIYCHQALAEKSEAAQVIETALDPLLGAIQTITSWTTTEFTHDVFWPLFIAATECGTNEQRRNTVQASCRDCIEKTGFWCNSAALSFVQAFWDRADSESHKTWVEYARDYQTESKSFLIY